MPATNTTTDPRYALFQTLVDCIKEQKTQHPFEVSEIDVQQYLDEELFEQEKKKLFTNVPLIAGFGAMIPKPGDFFTFDHAGQPLLIVRGKDQEVRCFFNVCRHRGVRLSDAEGVSSTRTFFCKYHHWTYDLEGRLIFVPSEEGFPGLDRQCRSLVSLPIKEAYGLIWVNPQPDGEIDLSSFLGNIADDLDLFDLAGSYFFRQSTKVCKANWKLIIEAFQDGYHVTRLHNKSVGGFFMDNRAVQEREKLHIRSIVGRNEMERAIDLPPEQWDFRNHASFSHYIFPNTITIMHPDYSSQLSVFPISVDETLVLHNCVVQRKPQSEKEQAHFERGFKTIDDKVFSEEDLHVCEQAQIGMASGANQTFLVGGYESGIRVFHQVLKDAMDKYPGSAI